MTDHLKPENKALVERVLGCGTARTYNRHEIDRLLDAARDEGRRAVVGGDWVLVPRAADADMEAAAYAGVKPYHDFGDTYWRTHMPKDLFRLAWNFMLAAAPSPPVADKVGEGVGTTERYADAVDAVIKIDAWLNDLAKADEGLAVSREIRRYTFNEDDGGALLYFRDNCIAAGGFIVRDLHNYSIEMRAFASPPTGDGKPDREADQP